MRSAHPTSPSLPGMPARTRAGDRCRSPPARHPVSETGDTRCRCRRTLTWDALSQSVVAFFVTRQIFAGAGKYGWEEEDKFLQAGFQISQRSDFFSELQSVDTMQRRPIINTRDEPHANNERYRRFHVIIGDSNLSLYANFLKIGTTCLVLQPLLNGAATVKMRILADPW